MTTITSTQSAQTNNALADMLPVDPFHSLLVHFGMLLGVEDFKTLEAYHRGKMWLHSAWLHRDGTVWGLKASTDTQTNEVRVAAGLAIDKLGRELYLDKDACLDISKWYVEHKDDADLKAIVEDGGDGTVSFDAHVVIQFKGCLARQVPALSEPCDGANSTTAYSRVVETVELLLVPGKTPEWRTPPGSLPYHRLRLLFGLEEAIEKDGVIIDADQEVLDARQAVLAKSAADQPAAYLEQFRYFSALDEMELAPASTTEGESYPLFPGVPPAPVPLADLTITLTGADTDWSLTQGDVDNKVRPVHVPTSTIQELLCGPMCNAASGSTGGTTSPSDGGPAPVTDAGGPRVDPDTVKLKGETITFTVSSALLKASVERRGVFVSSFETNDGWIDHDIKSVELQHSNSKYTVKVELRDTPEGNLVRLIVKGTGPHPFLNRNKIPLAGAKDGPAGSKNDGNDFVFMFSQDKTRS